MTPNPAQASSREAGGSAPAVAASAVVIALLICCSMSVLIWRGFISTSWDLGIFTQLAHQYADFQAPIVDIKGPGYNLLGDHFHPILVLLGPIFKLFPSGLTLLIVQAVLFAASAWPIAAEGVRRLGTAGGALLGAAYVSSWGLLNAVWAQFHEIAFAVPLLAFGLVWWLRERYLLSSVAIALLVFVKEDMGLTVAAFGAAIFLRDRARKSYALFHVIWGLFWFAAATRLILPALNPEGQWDYTDNVSAVESMFTAVDSKIAVVAALVMAAGVVGLRSPFMLMILPTLAWRFVGNVHWYWGFDFHYSATLIPIAAVALLDAAKDRHRLLAPAVALATSVLMLIHTQVNVFWKYQDYAAADATGALEVASQYETVGTDIYLLAHLVPRTHTYWYGTMGEVRPDALAMNWEKLGSDLEPWAEARYGGDWKTVYVQDEWQVIERVN